MSSSSSGVDDEELYDSMEQFPALSLVTLRKHFEFWDPLPQYVILLNACPPCTYSLDSHLQRFFLPWRLPSTTNRPAFSSLWRVSRFLPFRVGSQNPWPPRSVLPGEHLGSILHRLRVHSNTGSRSTTPCSNPHQVVYKFLAQGGIYHRVTTGGFSDRTTTGIVSYHADASSALNRKGDFPWLETHFCCVNRSAGSESNDGFCQSSANE